VFPYRFHAQERALKGGMRGVAFAALLGLSDFRKDAFATGLHAYYIQRKYPYAEISFSCPRLRPITTLSGEGEEQIVSVEGKGVGERQLLQIMCAYRLFMPFAGIPISTRESARFRDNIVTIAATTISAGVFRDHVVGMAATKISAGVSTGIGRHSEEVEEQGDNQFEIADGRDVAEVFAALKERGLQPVMNDYVYV